MKWYLLLTLFSANWIIWTGLVLVSAYTVIGWVMLAVASDNYSGSIKDPEARKADPDCERNYQCYLHMVKPGKYILIVALTLLTSLWPTKERVVMTVALSSVETYITKNPDSKINPAQLPELADKLVSSVEGALGLLGTTIQVADAKLKKNLIEKKQARRSTTTAGTAD